MSSTTIMVVSLIAGVIGWGTIRLLVPLSSQPLTQWGLNISQYDLVRRVVWASVVLLVGIPVYLGGLDSPFYIQMLVPVMFGIGLSESSISRWEAKQAAKKAKENAGKRQSRNKKPSRSRSQDKH